MKKISIFIIFVICFLTHSVFADELSPIKMDFSQAVKYSLEHNNDLKAMKYNLSATEKNIGIERSAMMPKIKFAEDFIATNNPTDALSLKLNQARAGNDDLTLSTLNHPTTVTNFLTRGVIEQSIYNRKAMIAISMAKKDYSANGYVYLRKQEELVNQVAQACLVVKTNQELIKVTEQGIKDANNNLKFAEEKFKNKSVSEQDVLRAKTEIDEITQKLIFDQKNLKVAQRKLGLLLGVENSVEILNTIPDIQLQDIDYYKDIAVYRNDIKATEIRVSNAKNNIKFAQADWYPTLNAVSSYNFYSVYPFAGEGHNYTAGAVFRWELFDGNKRKYEISKAKDKELESKEYLAGLKLAVGFKVYEAYSNIEALQKNLELAILTKKAAEKDTAIVLKKWQDSSVPFIDLTDAQSNLDDARANVVKRQNELKAAIINLCFESGTISQELLQR